ncbi:MAG: phosphoesterase [Pseudomonadota bacterium]
MKRVIAYHGRCLDGMASAALAAKLLEQVDGPADQVVFKPQVHRQGNRFDDAALDGDSNAIVDFKYSASPRLHWWFDHHKSAFVDDAARAHHATRPPERFVLDLAAPSCAHVLDAVARTQHGLQLIADDTLAWVDRVDSARFRSAAEAVELAHPALQLMTWVETAPHDEVSALIPRFLEQPIAELVAQQPVRSALAAQLAQHRANIELFRRHARLQGPVLLCDLGSVEVDGFNKFIGYYLFPEAVYSVVVTQGSERSKVSVGSNPWRADERRHDIAALCEAHGGGGHPAVGAVTLPPGQVARARDIAQQIVQQLAGHPS